LTCSPRGRCLGITIQESSNLSEKQDENKEVIGDSNVNLGATFTQVPASLTYISKTATETVITLKIEGDSVPSHLTYRIEESTQTIDPSFVYTIPIESNGLVQLTLPISAQDTSEAEGQAVEIVIHSNLGSLSTTITKEAPVAGQWSGGLQFQTFGSLQFPFQFEIVTQPPNVSLENAEEAWILFPFSSANFFTTQTSERTPLSDHQAQKLEYDQLSQTWKAAFRNQYVFHTDSILDVTDRNIVRSIRIDLNSDEGNQIYGTLSDQWSGLYEQRTNSGVVNPAIVSYIGSFDMVRVGEARLIDEVNESTNLTNTMNPSPLTIPLDECQDDMFIPMTSDEVYLSFTNQNEQTWSCGRNGEGYTRIDQFESNSSIGNTSREECALAFAYTSLSGETTAGRIRSYLEGDAPDSRSFAEFMEDCASGENGECRPNPKVLCARQLLAYTYSNANDDLLFAEDLIFSFIKTTREAFLGRQLGAFQTDTITRLDWLKSTDFPAVVTTAVRSYLNNLLEMWVSNVVNVHIDVVQQQYDLSAVALLARQPSDEASKARRKEILFEMSQSWRGSVNALTLATQRWNALLMSAREREEKTLLVSSRMLDLYVIAGLANNLNLRADAGFANAAFSSGFAALATELNQLRLPFDQLIYARDAEVVVSRSLDPLANNYNLLENKEMNANTKIRDSISSIGDLITTANENALNDAQLRNQLSNEIDLLRDELIKLCGLPVDCSINDVETEDHPECEIKVEADKCGYVIQNNDNVALSEQNISKAGDAVLAISKALINETLAREELNIALKKTLLEKESADEFANLISKWNNKRLESGNEIKMHINQNSAMWQGQLAEMKANFEDQNQRRINLATDAQNDAQKWSQIRINGETSDLNYTIAAVQTRRVASTAKQTADYIAASARLKSAGFPRAAGVATDPSSVKRMAIATQAMARMKKAGITAEIAGTTAAEIRIAADYEYALRNAELTNLQEQDIADDLMQEAKIAELVNAASLSGSQRELDMWRTRELIDLMRQQAEAELVYQ
jgi:hypothetical protein